MLQQLSPEQETLMLQVRDEWMNLAFRENSKGINKPLFEEGIEWLYKDILGKPKPKVIYCDSWLSCVLTIAILKKNPKWLPNKIHLSKVRASVGASVWDSVRASVGASVRDSVGASVRDSVWASVR